MRNANKTVATDASVEDFIAAIEHPRQSQQAAALHALFSRTTGFTGRMWGSSIIGYGRYHYRYKTGREGDFLATGFAPRSGKFSIYIMPGYANFDDILQRLGKHRTGKSCLYINKVADIDLDVLAELIRAGLKDLDRHWPVLPE